MDIKTLNNIYSENKKLDAIFLDVYGNDDEIVLKNKLELLVELGELANETKCFKYWSKKQMNKEKALLEYADVLLMILYFFNQLDITFHEEFPKENNLDLNNEFIYLFNQSSKLNDSYNKDILKDILINFLRLGKILDFSEEEIKISCLNKISINKERFNIEY